MAAKDRRTGPRDLPEIRHRIRDGSTAHRQHRRERGVGILPEINLSFMIRAILKSSGQGFQHRVRLRRIGLTCFPDRTRHKN